MKKVVVELDFVGAKTKSKAMKKVSSLAGVESISIGNDKKMIVIGDIDPVLLVAKLKKICTTKILSVRPKEEEGKKKPAENNDNIQEKEVDNVVVVKAAYCYHTYPPPSPFHYVIEQDPTRCVIC